jgi:hypothetical protein
MARLLESRSAVGPLHSICRSTENDTPLTITGRWQARRQPQNCRHSACSRYQDCRDPRAFRTHCGKTHCGKDWCGLTYDREDWKIGEAYRADDLTGQGSSTAAEVYEDFFMPALFLEWAPRVADVAQLAPGRKVDPRPYDRRCAIQRAAACGQDAIGWVRATRRHSGVSLASAHRHRNQGVSPTPLIHFLRLRAGELPKCADHRHSIT